MSVLITGVDMPKSCVECIFECVGVCYVNLKTCPKGRVTQSCPLIPIPDHGDLIDRDALMTSLGMAMDCESCPNRTEVYYFCGLPREVMEVCEELENAPVIIPAERSEDEQ